MFAQTFIALSDERLQANSLCRFAMVVMQQAAKSFAACDRPSGLANFVGGLN
jgi:hypothetical protein